MIIGCRKTTQKDATEQCEVASTCHAVITTMHIFLLQLWYKGLDHSNLANFASEIAKTVVVSYEKWRLSMALFLTLFTAVSVCTIAAPLAQQSIAPSSNSQQSSSLPLLSPAVQVASPPPQRLSSCSGGAAILSVSVDSDYAAASSELLAMLSSAGLVLASSR